MIDFYALTSPNVQKIYIMLEECGLPYKEHFIDVWKGDQYSPEFSKINPNNKIPAIVDSDGPGGRPYTVFESGAILMYLAEKTGKFLPKDMAKKYDVIQWLLFQLTGVGPMFGQWTHFKMFAPKGGSDYSAARYTSELNRLYGVLEKRLGQAPYLGGQDYSIADIDLSVDPQPRRPGREVGRPSQSGALVQCHQRAAGGEGCARQDRGHQVQP